VQGASRGSAQPRCWGAHGAALPPAASLAPHARVAAHSTRLTLAITCG
jgi:hypothetical protein